MEVELGYGLNVQNVQDDVGNLWKLPMGMCVISV